MARTIREARLGTVTARRRLKPGRQPHWHTIVAGRDHLGWQRWPDDKIGRWVLRRRRGGSYNTEAIGVADDAAPADGVSILSFDQARSKAVELASSEMRPAGRITVSRAVADYIDFLKAQGRGTYHVESTAVTHILPRLGNVEVALLTSIQLRRWLIDIAEQPARKRSKADRQQKFKSMNDEESLRRRRSSANRILATLKAALNHCYDERRCSSNDAWGRRLKRFKGVDGVRTRYLSTDEAVRLLNASDPDFRLLVRAALETGMRYGELGRLEVADFIPDVGTVSVRKSKTGRARHVVLTREGSEFFRQACAGRAGSARMFLRGDGEPWGKSNHGRLIAEANLRAKIDPPITFHGLRHTWASLAVMNGVPLMVVARNLGHVDTKMVEKVRPPGAELHQRRHPRRRAAVQHSLWQRGAAAQTKNKKRSVRTLADLLLQRVGVGSLTIGVMIASHIGRQWLTSAHRVYSSLNPTGTRSPSVWRWMSVVGWRSLRRRTQSGVTDTRPWLRGGVPKDIDLARSGVTPAQ